MHPYVKIITKEMKIIEFCAKSYLYENIKDINKNN